jgi:DNA-binding PadR family transcriptional regulator
MSLQHKLLLLGILHRQQMHGYQLFEYIDQGLSVCTDLTRPTAYYLLNKMAEDGWVSEEQMQEGNRPVRKVYQLTSLGESEYQRLLRENLSQYQPVSFAGDIGLAMLDQLSSAEVVTLLQERRENLERAYQEAQTAPVHQGSLQFAIRHQVYFLTQELKWLDQILAELTESG